MSIADSVKGDLTAAMKAGEREQVKALRLVLSELQRAQKEGDGDEVAVLRRERKRRGDAAAAYRDGGRPELAQAEEVEAQMIGAYLPSALSDDELDAIVDAAIAQTGAQTPREMGAVMKAVMPRVAGRADGKRVSARVKEGLGVGSVSH